MPCANILNTVMMTMQYKTKIIEEEARNGDECTTSPKIVTSMPSVWVSIYKMMLVISILFVTPPKAFHASDTHRYYTFLFDAYREYFSDAAMLLCYFASIAC